MNHNHTHEAGTHVPASLISGGIVTGSWLYDYDDDEMRPRNRKAS